MKLKIACLVIVACLLPNLAFAAARLKPCDMGSATDENVTMTMTTGDPAGAAQRLPDDSMVLKPGRRVGAVPEIKSASDPRRCLVDAMTVAVRNNGVLRDIYREGTTNPDNRGAIPDSRYDFMIRDRSLSDDRRREALRFKYEEETKQYVQPVIDDLRRRIRSNVVARINTYRSQGLSTADIAARLQAEPVRLLIYAHGGMVSHQNAIFSAESLAPMMIRDGYVPLFLVWNSDFLVSYGDRLCCERKGSTDPDTQFNQFYFIPARLLSDLGGSIFAAPENYGQEVVRFNQSVMQRDHDLFTLNYDDVDQDCRYFTRVENPTGTSTCSHIVFPEFRTGTQTTTAVDKAKAILNGNNHGPDAGSSTLYVGLMPARLVTTALGSHVGASAWDNMVRRTRTGFDNENVACGDDDGLLRDDEPISCANGGFTLFFDKLQSDLLSAKDPGNGTQALVPVGDLAELDGASIKVPVTIEFYGHSMGAIVGDELFAHYSNLPVSKIVYMAAADTIRDFKRSTAVVIADKAPRERPRFYNLTLNPLNESEERVGKGALPEGSLLEWIDEMFNGPRTSDDRTMGKWKNFEATLPTWNLNIPAEDGVLSSINATVFPRQHDLLRSTVAEEAELYNRMCDRRRAYGEPRDAFVCYPLTHGQFNHYTFWRTPYITLGQEHCTKTVDRAAAAASAAPSSAAGALPVKAARNVRQQDPAATITCPPAAGGQS